MKISPSVKKALQGFAIIQSLRSGSRLEVQWLIARRVCQLPGATLAGSFS